MALPSCQSAVQDGETEKRLDVLEKSIVQIRQEQVKTRRVLKEVAVRQDLLKKGMLRAEKKLKNDRTLIGRLGQNSDQDAEAIDDLSAAVEGMISPIQKMQVEISRLKTRFFRYCQRQQELVQQGPGKAAQLKEQAAKKPAAPAGPPVDRKKRKKVLESVA